MRGSWERRFAAVARSTLSRRFEGLAGMQRWVSLGASTFVPALVAGLAMIRVCARRRRRVPSVKWMQAHHLRQLLAVNNGTMQRIHFLASV